MRYLSRYRSRSRYSESLRKTHHTFDPCAAYRNHRAVYLLAGHAFLSKYERGLQIRHTVYLVRGGRSYLPASSLTICCFCEAELERSGWRLQSMSSAGSTVSDYAQIHTEEKVDKILREDEHLGVIDIG